MVWTYQINISNISSETTFEPGGIIALIAIWDKIYDFNFLLQVIGKMFTGPLWVGRETRQTRREAVVRYLLWELRRLWKCLQTHRQGLSSLLKWSFYSNAFRDRLYPALFSFHLETVNAPLIIIFTCPSSTQTKQNDMMWLWLLAHCLSPCSKRECVEGMAWNSSR